MADNLNLREPDMRPSRSQSSRGNFGYAKPAGDDIFEMRINYGPGYRLYCALKGNGLVPLLLRGNKSSQQRNREGEEAKSGVRMTEAKMKKTAKWNASKYLEAKADITAYLNAALEDSDISVIAAALGDIARAKGMTQLAKETGITRDGLYKFTRRCPLRETHRSIEYRK